MQPRRRRHHRRHTVQLQGLERLNIIRTRAPSLLVLDNELTLPFTTLQLSKTGKTDAHHGRKEPTVFPRLCSIICYLAGFALFGFFMLGWLTGSLNTWPVWLFISYIGVIATLLWAAYEIGELIDKAEKMDNNN
jgi:hypothetical protein